MSDGQDHTKDETLPDPAAIADPPEAPDPDPSISPPPEAPAQTASPEFYALHGLLTDVVGLVEGIAAGAPAGHAFGNRIAGLKASLGTLWAMAHDPK